MHWRYDKSLGITVKGYEDMIYDDNLRALQARYTDIYEAVTDGGFAQAEDTACDAQGACVESAAYEDSAVYAETARNGEKLVKYCRHGRDYYLNSRYNPAAEAEKFMAEVLNMPDESVLVMVGLANGSFAKEFLDKNKKNVMCIIFEPDASIFVQTLRQIDIAGILSDERVILIVDGINEALLSVCLTKLIQPYNKKTNRYIVLPKYKELFELACAKVERLLAEQSDRLKAETSTVVSYGPKTYKNNIYNMQYLPGCRSGRDYAGLFPEELPVIIVSAGPSLDKNIGLLAQAKGKALIVAVDTAIPRVLEKGIIPDLVISVDYNKSLKHFKADGVSDLTFLADMDMNSTVLDFVKPKNIIFNSSDSLLWDRLFRNEGSEILTVESGGSVSTAAIAHMLSWGFKRIILVGQDLALTGNRVHAGEADNSAAENKWETTYVQGIDGKDILTRKDYCIYIRWIEDIGYQYKEIELIDATEGGAKKRNTTVMTLREAIDKYCTKEYDIGSVIMSVPRLFEGNKRAMIIDSLKGMKNNLRNMRKLMINGTADCRMGALMLSRGDYNVKELKRINASVGKLDEMLFASEERTYLSKYVSNADIDFADDMYLEETDDIQEAIRMYEKSGKYYQTLAEAIPRMIEIIDDCIGRMES